MPLSATECECLGVPLSASGGFVLAWLSQVALPHLEARKLYEAAIIVSKELGLDAKVHLHAPACS